VYERSETLETWTLYIDGQWRTATGNGHFDSTDPFTGKVWSRVPRATVEDVDMVDHHSHQFRPHAIAQTATPYPHVS